MQPLIVGGAMLYVRVDEFASFKAYMFCGVFLIAAVSEGLVAKTTIEKVGTRQILSGNHVTYTCLVRQP